MSAPPNQDRFSRVISYLRVSVTDRCNLRCFYCMPDKGVPLLPHEEVLTYEEILRVVRAGLRLGITKVRITGGEPLVRRGIEGLVAEVAALPGITDLSLTTNGVLLAEKAAALRKAGLCRVNISLDSRQKERFARITGCDLQERVREGISAALSAGFSRVKLNVVLLAGMNTDEAADFAEMTLATAMDVRFIEYMPVAGRRNFDEKLFAPAAEARALIEERFGALVPEPAEAMDGPAVMARIPGAPGRVGFIGAVSGHFCETCNRLRLTPDGRLLPCLFSGAEIGLKGPLRAGASEEEIRALLHGAILSKPKSHREFPEDRGRGMSRIGG
ncbi:MAG: GTP 3',8-cyclase MoaA [Thermodesulfobacteriota bacterium]